MFIPPYLCGVLSVIGIEFALLIAFALIRMQKKK